MFEGQLEDKRAANGTDAHTLTHTKRNQHTYTNARSHLKHTHILVFDVK